MAKYLIALGLSAVLSSSVFAVSMNFGGHFRADTAYYGSLSLGAAGVPSAEKTYLAGRALLDPSLVIDDHFTLRSQWSLITSPNISPQATAPLEPGQGGFIFGDPGSVSLNLNRAWLEWTSDFGVLRIGRMPVAWGYGLVYDDGNRMWDDWQTTFDRFEYRLHLGHIIGGIAYSKPRKRSVIGGSNDQDFYAVYIVYDNPELEVEAGIMYEKQARTGQDSELLNTSKPTGVDRALMLGLPANSRTPFPKNNNLVDVYVKKTLRYFTFGGEITWIGGKAVDFDGVGGDDSLSAFGVLLSAAYQQHMLKAFLEFVFASGDANVNDSSMNGFIVLNRNRHPGLILGQELLGSSHGNHQGLGSLFAYGSSQNTFSGAWFLKPGIRLDLSQSWSVGAEVIIARKAATPAGESSNLGIELDLGAEHAVYQNAFIGANAGILFPGAGLGNTSKKPVAIRASFGVTF